MFDSILRFMQLIPRRLHVPAALRSVVKRLLHLVDRIVAVPLTYVRIWMNLRKCHRSLEIGPGWKRISGFETLDIRPGRQVDYVLDASKPLPFGDATFDLLYTSHVLEHIPWYRTEDVLREWVRILKPGGQFELWVPDGLKICQTLIEAETAGVNNTHLDGWYKFNPRRDPCIWAAGRLFTYGDGTARRGGPKWHRALFTERYLRDVLKRLWLVEIAIMGREEVRGYDHGWISLGIRGTKPRNK